MESTIQNAILQALSASNDAMEPHEIFTQIGNVPFADFTKAVKELEEQARIVISKKGKLLLPQAAGLTPARIISQSRNYSFARPLDGGEDIYIPAEWVRNALVSDLVFLTKVRPSYKGMEGRVERVVAKGSRLITGTVQRDHSGCELIPDAAFRFPVPIERGTAMGARNGDKVRALLALRPRTNRLTARVVKIYGRSESARICADAIIDAAGIPNAFPAEVTLEARVLNERGITRQELAGRLDLRGEKIFTIDGADAKDLDDAISVEKTGDGYKIGVHIADVSHYVREKSELDAEAFKRGTSVYFADRVIPMLPKELSNGICSLNAGQDKLTFSCFATLDNTGRLVGYEFHKSVIRSVVRGVYSEVNAILDGTAGEEVLRKYEPVLDSLHLAEELAQLLEKRGRQRGTMDLESRESRFTLNEKGVCVSIEPRTQGRAERLIEQFMLTANQSAALYARGADVPFVYRVHESPDPERLLTLNKLVGALGLKNQRLKEGVRSSDFAQLLEQAEGTPAARIISHQVLRTMAKARYDDRPLGHFGLALADYCHFTSPIRRYPDTAIHRILTALVNGENVTTIQRHYAEFVKEASRQSSECEVRAMRAERDAESCYMAEYMAQHIGEEFEGVISGVTPRGIFVELENTAEGFVSLEQFPGCRFQFDGLTTHKDEISGRTLRIGDPMRIRVVAAQVATGMVDFAPVEGKEDE